MQTVRHSTPTGLPVGCRRSQPGVPDGDFTASYEFYRLREKPGIGAFGKGMQKTSNSPANRRIQCLLWSSEIGPVCGEVVGEWYHIRPIFRQANHTGRAQRRCLPINGRQAVSFCSSHSQSPSPLFCIQFMAASTFISRYLASVPIETVWPRPRDHKTRSVSSHRTPYQKLLSAGGRL